MAVTITTGQPYYVRGTSGYFKGELTDMDGNAAIDCYFEYRIKGAATWTNDTSAAAETMTAVGEFNSASITLTEGETYEVRAVATWDDGGAQYAYGSTVEFDAAWVREGSEEDFERGILDGVEVIGNSLKITPVLTEDKFDASSNPSGGSYTSIIQNFTTNQAFNLYSISFYTRVPIGTVSMELNIYDSTDAVMYGPHTQSLSNTDFAWVDFILDDPLVLADATAYYIKFTSTGIRISSANSTLHNGRYWQSNGFTIPTAYNGTLGIALIDGQYMSGDREMPYLITDTSADIAWTATTPTSTTLAVEAQVQGTTAISNEAVGIGDGTTTVFSLDHWPANTPTVTVNAVAETGFTLGDDRRTITFTTAPANTHAILASYTAVDDPVVDAVEIQELDLDSPAGGTFKLGDGVDEDTIPYNADALRVAGWIVEEFTADGTFNVPAGVSAVDVLVVAGGGGGGSRQGGGGGAGGLIFEESFVVTPEAAISVTVGAGGAGGTSGGRGTNGSDSVFSTLTATGGGGGGGRTTNSTGSAGGSGGGGGGGELSTTVNSGGAGTVGQGYAGGSSIGNSAGGGGGASEVGANGTGYLSTGGAGGDGLDYSTYFGTSVGETGYFAGGGGGGSYGNLIDSAGGLGGGGDGASANSTETLKAGEAGLANTGGGGGGSTDGGNTGGAGGSGVVLVRYKQTNGLVDIHGRDNVTVTESSGVFTITFDVSVGDSNLTADFTGLT